MVSFLQHNHEHADCKLCVLDPRGKLISFLLAIINIIIIPSQSFIQYTIISLCLFLIILLSHQPLNYYIKNVLKIYPMIFFVTFLIPFNQSIVLDVKEILYTIGSVNLYRDGIIVFINLNIRSILIFTSSLILISETPINALLKALMTLHIPKWFEAVVIYMQRFMHILGSEFHRMHLAFAARSFNMSFISKTRAIAKMSGVYFSRLLDRSERSHLAMVSRGFNGEIYTRYQLHWRFIDTIIVALNLILFSILIFGWIK